MIDRRNFLAKLSGLTGAILIPYPTFPEQSKINRDKWGELLPMRKLGKTGFEVTTLGYGDVKPRFSDNSGIPELLVICHVLLGLFFVVTLLALTNRRDGGSRGVDEGSKRSV